jgi:uncharacterized protein YqgC (DUF456 family)
VTATELLVAVAIVIGLLGVLIPILPGGMLVGAAILVWAVATGGTTAWLVFGAAAAVLAIGAVVKYVVPGRRLKEVGIPSSTQWTGVAAGVVGFFVIPVIGLPIGFVLGIYLAELRRVGHAAGGSTMAALRAVGLSIFIEFAAAVLAAAAWVGGVVVT